jgi:hypothetical protein
VLDVAWELGSWDLARIEAPPFVRPGASEQESLECMGAFGSLPVRSTGQPPIVAEVPDAEDLIEAASRAATCNGSSARCAAACGPKSPRT